MKSTIISVCKIIETLAADPFAVDIPLENRDAWPHGQTHVASMMRVCHIQHRLHDVSSVEILRTPQHLKGVPH